MKKYFQLSVLLALAFTQAGCFIVSGVLDLTFSNRPRLSHLASKNRKNMTQLKLGMTRSEVLAVMGNPHSSEVYQIDNANLELLIYLTQPARFNDHIQQRHLTPVALRENKVIGWSKSYFDAPKKISTPE